jgi:two-component system alkaline phosphatase synthesis response regulator PhoP
LIWDLLRQSTQPQEVEPEIRHSAGRHGLIAIMSDPAHTVTWVKPVPSATSHLYTLPAKGLRLLIVAVARTVLVVEDDVDISRLLRLTLEKDHFKVRTVTDGQAALQLAQREVPDLIILDVMLPLVDGFEVCRRLRLDIRTSRVPVLMLSAKSEEIDRVLGLELGADDYLTKPFSPRELLARVKALLRRENRQATDGDRIVDERQVELSSREFGLLACLVSGKGRVFSRAQLLDQVWGFDYVGGPRTVDVHINHLREKLPEISERIVTVKSVGYKFADQLPSS